jgi:hypothetical protein
MSLNALVAYLYSSVGPGLPAASIPNVPEVLLDPLVAFLEASCKTLQWSYDPIEGCLVLHWTAGTLHLPGRSRC